MRRAQEWSREFFRGCVSQLNTPENKGERRLHGGEGFEPRNGLANLPTFPDRQHQRKRVRANAFLIPMRWSMPSRMQLSPNSTSSTGDSLNPYCPPLMIEAKFGYCRRWRSDKRNALTSSACFWVWPPASTSRESLTTLRAYPSSSRAHRRQSAASRSEPDIDRSNASSHFKTLGVAGDPTMGTSRSHG